MQRNLDKIGLIIHRVLDSKRGPDYATRKTSLSIFQFNFNLAKWPFCKESRKQLNGLFSEGLKCYRETDELLLPIFLFQHIQLRNGGVFFLFLSVLSALFQFKQSIFYCEGTQDILRNLLEDVQGFLKDNASLKFTSQSITLGNCILWRNICVTFLESLIFWAFSQLLLFFWYA